MNLGYTLLWRKTWDNPVLHERGKVFSRLEAWLYLVNVMASGIDTDTLKRGEFEASERLLSKAWRWSKTSVHRFLISLEQNRMISRVDHFVDHFSDRFIICKYDIYNPVRTAKWTAKWTTIKESIKEREIKDTCVGKADTTKPHPETLLEIYREVNQKLPEVKAFTPERERKCRARINHAESTGCLSRFLETFRSAVTKSQQTRFLCGEGNRGWKASFDWFIANDTNIYAVIEGKYDGCGANKAGLFKTPDEETRERINEIWQRKLAAAGHNSTDS